MIRILFDGFYFFVGYLVGIFLIVIFFLMMMFFFGWEFGINIVAGDDYVVWLMVVMVFLGFVYIFRFGELICIGFVFD